MISWPHEAQHRLPDLLAGWFEATPPTLSTSPEGALHADVAGLRLHMTITASDQIGTLSSAARHLARAAATDRIPLVVVPYMGPTARAWAKEQGLAWADLSGNVHLRAPGVYVQVDGQPNRYKRPGRPSHAFTPRYARVPRVLLTEPDRAWLQRDLAAATDLPAGTVSKVVRTLRHEGLITRDSAGALRVQEPSVLLDAWAQQADFQQHHIRRFHAVSRGGPDVLNRLAERLRTSDTTWAATGLAAAWLQTNYADFRLTTLYTDPFPLHLDRLGLREVERGENVWLVAPRDPGVFHARSERAGVWCVHPVQTYIDLLDHPERAEDAARELRRVLLTRSTP